MSEYGWLLAVVALFYVIDIAWVVPPGAVLFTGFHQPLRPRLAAGSGPRILGRLVLVPAGWLPLTRVLVCELPPVTLDDGGLRLEPEYALPPALAPSPAGAVGYRELKTVESRGSSLVVDGGRELRLSSRREARVLAGAIERARASSPAAARGELWRQSLDVGQLEERVGLWQESSRAVRWLATLLFGYVFVGLPSVWLWDLPLSLVELLAPYLVLLVGVQVSFWLAHRRLYPEQRRERLAKVGAMILSPAEAMAAPHALSRDVLGAAHPLAAARVVASAAELRRLVELTLRAVRFPAPDDRVSLETRERLERFAASHGIDPQAACAAPPAEEGCVVYCPRCLAQLRTGERFCPGCPGVAMLRLAGT